MAGSPPAPLVHEASPVTAGKPAGFVAPAVLPPVQARKGGRQIEKTHNTEGLGSENISMFFSNSIVNRKGFLPRPALFRAWTGIGTAGAHHDAGLPDVAGAFYSVHSANGSQYTSGAFTQSQGGAYFAGGNSHAEFGITFRASNSNKTYGASPTVMPTSVDLPICLYLGNSA